MADPSQPIVTLRLVFRAGSADDPPGKEGLTELTAALLAQGGTRRLSSAQLIRTLYPMAAELSSRTDKELTAFHGRVHRDLLPRFFELFTDLVVAPRLDQNEFERLRQDALDEVRTGLRGMSDEALGQAALESVLYKGHPYAHPEVGTVQGLSRITLEDVKAHWRRVFTQDRLVVGLAGPVDAALAARLKAKLSALPRTGAPLPQIPPPPETSGKALILEKKEALSTAISAGHAYSLRRGDPDYFPVAFALSYLGQHRQTNGVLFKELRERRGLNYGTYAYIEHFEQDAATTYPETNTVRSQQDFTLWIRPVEPGHALFATRGALFFLDRLRQSLIPVDEFERARNFLIGYTRLWEQTDAQRLGYVLDALYDGVPSFLESFRKALASLTREEVLEAVRRQIHPEQLAFAFVAPDGKALVERIREGRPTPLSYTSPKPAELLREDQSIAKLPLPIQPSETRLESAAEFMER
jgi:zinc protease